MLHTYVGRDRDQVKRVAEGPMKAYLGAATALVAAEAHRASAAAAVRAWRAERRNGMVGFLSGGLANRRAPMVLGMGYTLEAPE